MNRMSIVRVDLLVVRMEPAGSLTTGRGHSHDRAASREPEKEWVADRKTTQRVPRNLVGRTHSRVGMVDSLLVERYVFCRWDMKNYSPVGATTAHRG